MDPFSPEDHAILEAAFQQNPKPDKAERIALVKSVALGEKEVQVHLKPIA
jgi:Homeodomain